MRVCVCVCVCECVCVCVCRPVIQQFVWVGSLFLISSLLLSVPMLPPSPMQQGQVWKVCKVYHLPLMKPHTPSPFLNFLLFLFPLPSSFSSSSSSNSNSWLPVLICWSSPLCLTPLHVWICNAENKTGLHSLSKEIQCVFSFAYDKAFKHTLLFFCALFGKRHLCSYRGLLSRNPKLDLTRFVCEHQKQTAGCWIKIKICQIGECFDPQFLTK